jgi:hypothetical protein
MAAAPSIPLKNAIRMTHRVSMMHLLLDQKTDEQPAGRAERRRQQGGDASVFAVESQPHTTF